MDAERNKVIVRDFIATWNRGDVEGLATYWAPNVVHHARQQSHGQEGIRQVNGAFMSAFPDLHYEIHDLVGEGDMVVARMTARATHLGEFLGVPPSGRAVSCSLIQMARVQDDKIVEHWGLTDELDLLEQIGLVPGEYLAVMS